MFRKVNSENDKEIFLKLWSSACIEKGFEIESVSSESDLFLILNKEESPIGTVEFKPFKIIEKSTNQAFPFTSLEMIYQNPSGVFEIDKVSLIKNQRGANIRKVLKVIYTYAVENNHTYGIMLLDPLFYRSLKIFYKLPIKKVSNKFFYKGDYVIPSVIDFEIIKNNLKDYEWASKIKELEHQK